MNISCSGGGNIMYDLRAETIPNCIKYISSTLSTMVMNTKLLYLNPFNQFIVLGNKNYQKFYRDILFCDYDGTEWNKYKMKMPYGITNGFGALIAYDYILFVFYYYRKEVWCLDFCQNRWYQTEGLFDLTSYLCINPFTALPHFIKSNHDTVHFIQATDGRHHVVVELLDVIPKDLKIKLCSKYMILLNGYIHQIILHDMKINSIVPLDMIVLLGKFYSNLM